MRGVQHGGRSRLRKVTFEVTFDETRRARREEDAGGGGGVLRGSVARHSPPCAHVYMHMRACAYNMRVQHARTRSCMHMRARVHDGSMCTRAHGMCMHMREAHRECMRPRWRWPARATRSLPRRRQFRQPSGRGEERTACLAMETWCAGETTPCRPKGRTLGRHAKRIRRSSLQQHHHHHHRHRQRR